MRRASVWTVWMLVVGVVAAATGCRGRITDADIRNMSLTDVRLLWLEQRARPDQRLLALVDPRSPEAFAEAHIPGAIHLTLPEVAGRREPPGVLSGARRVVVYAEGPGAVTGRAMTKRLLSMGVGQTRLFGGGIIEWADAGFPVEAGAPEPLGRSRGEVDRRPVP